MAGPTKPVPCDRGPSEAGVRFARRCVGLIEYLGVTPKSDGHSRRELGPATACIAYIARPLEATRDGVTGKALPADTCEAILPGVYEYAKSQG